MALPVINVRDAIVAEPTSGTAQLRFRIFLDKPATTNVTISYALLDGTATGESDYYRDTRTITIQAGQQEVFLPVSVVGDTRAEGEERFSLLLTSAENATFIGSAAALQVTGIISEGSSPTLLDARAIAAPIAAAGAGALPTLDVRNVAVYEGNSGNAPAQFLVMLDKPATAPVTFSYYFQDATASSGRNDYYGDARTFTIDVGQQSAILSRSSVVGDTANEGRESFNLVVAAVQNARLAGNAAVAVATATIIDGDDGVTSLTAGIGDFSTKIFGPASMSTLLPTMAVSNPSVIEADSGTVTLRYLITFDRVLTSAVTVNYQTQDGTASGANNDYYYNAREITIPAGVQSWWVEVTSVGDTAIEGNETVQLIFNAMTNAVFAGGAAALVATGTIIDDDGGTPTMVAGVGAANATQAFGLDSGNSLPTVTVVSTSTAEGNSGTSTVGVYALLSRVSTSDVTFRFDTLDGTATASSDYYGQQARTGTIPAGELGGYIALSVIGDTAIEGDEAFSVRLSNLSGGVFAGGGTTATAQVLIRDNDGGGTAGQKAGPEFTRTVTPTGDVRIGSAGSDVFRGTAGNDLLAGGEGDDTLTGGLGDDRLEGGSGYDLTLWSGARRQYAVAGNASAGFAITGVEGRDAATGVERFQFVDGSLFVDPNSTGAQVQRMYDTVLGRAPDAGGLDYWVDRIEDDRQSLVAVADALAASAEFRQATGGLGNAAFVDYVYSHALGRGADQSGRDYWTRQLDGGLSRGDMLVFFSEGAEHRARTATLTDQGYFQTDDQAQAIALLYDSAVGRLPDVNGLTYWLGQMRAGTSLAQVANAFAASPEFTAATRGKSNAQVVDFMYQNTLDRLPDAQGNAYWTGRLDAGMTRAELLLLFSQGDEHSQLYASHIIGGIDVMM